MEIFFFTLGGNLASWARFSLKTNIRVEWKEGSYVYSGARLPLRAHCLPSRQLTVGVRCLTELRWLSLRPLAKQAKRDENTTVAWDSIW